MTNTTIRVGSRIRYRPAFGRGPVCVARVTENDFKNGRALVGLNNGHWCYNDAVESVELPLPRSMFLTSAQRQALKKVWTRNACGLTYRAFRKTVTLGIGMDCVMVPWAGMWLGIETDGHCHS